MSDQKGYEIRFIAGKYAQKRGCLGWVDKSRMHNNGSKVAIFVKEKGRDEKRTYVLKSSFTKKQGYTSNATYAEAVFDQCPDLERKMIDLCRSLAKCDIQKDSRGMMDLFRVTMDEATQWQIAKGSRATYRQIKWSRNYSENIKKH